MIQNANSGIATESGGEGSHEETRRTGPDWASQCPNCEHLEQRDHAPGVKASTPRCPECNWPMNCVELGLIDDDLQEEHAEQVEA